MGGGGGRRDSQEVKFWGAKTRDLGVSGRQHSTPYSNLALMNPQNASRRGLAPSRLVFLETLPDIVTFPRGQNRLSLGSHLTHILSNQILPAAVCPSAVPHCPLHLFLSTADPVLSPNLSGEAFLPCSPPLPPPLLLSFSPGGEGAGQRRGWAAEGRSWLETRKGCLQRGTAKGGGKTGREGGMRHGEKRDAGRTPLAATSPSPVSYLPGSRAEESLARFGGSSPLKPTSPVWHG